MPRPASFRPDYETSKPGTGLVTGFMIGGELAWLALFAGGL